MSAEYYHVYLSEGNIANHLKKNISLNDLLLEWVCPYIAQDAVCVGSRINSFQVYDIMIIYLTSNPIDSDFPINKADTIKKEKNKIIQQTYYKRGLIKWLEENNTNVTDKVYAEASKYLENGLYSRYKNRFSKREKISFMIMPLKNKKVRENFQYAIKPSVEKYGYQINPIDELQFSGSITNQILNEIVRSTFIIADLTDERPNCYYELGYAQALKKPIIILAEEGTVRHFDISVENWIFWNDFKDLKEKFDSRLKVLIDQHFG